MTLHVDLVDPMLEAEIVEPTTVSLEPIAEVVEPATISLEPTLVMEAMTP